MTEKPRQGLKNSIVEFFRHRESGNCPDSIGRAAATAPLRADSPKNVVTRPFRGCVIYGVWAAPEDRSFSRLGFYAALALMLLLMASTSAPAQAENSEYRESLLALGERDQRYRTSLQACTGDPEAEARRRCWQRIQTLDEQNLQTLRRLIWQRGWPLSSEVGDDAAFAAFLVIQHSDLGSMLLHLPVVNVAVMAGELRPSALALLTDRTRHFSGQPQVYGTQHGALTPPLSSRWLIEPERVNARRAQLGLRPLP